MTMNIVKAQKMLRNLGSKIQVNGRWSIGMQTSICSFQRRRCLLITGELDKATWKELKKQNRWWRRLARKVCGHHSKN